ncbi:MAG: metallophosphoesterase [Armatimonadetes bacterium]|nr:metallophosphoesterase [Armatimonadota bacterium]
MRFLLALLFWSVPFGCQYLYCQDSILRCAVIGDYGKAGANEAAVAALVKSWNPDLILTVGDNNYPRGSDTTIDRNIGQYYHEFIAPYRGAFGAGGTVNRFYPSLGNHDWYTPGAKPYLEYFTLPGNERYYEVAQGSVRFFALDSDKHEPDGTSDTSIQARWLKERLQAATEPWKIVYFHHPPYLSGAHHRPDTAMRWPFAEWGATAVLAGHEHIYERLSVDGIPYFVNGLGGSNIYPEGVAIPQSQFRYNATHGAMLVEASATEIWFRFINVQGDTVDTERVFRKDSTREKKR